MNFVLDASVTVLWLFQDGQPAGTERLAPLADALGEVLELALVVLLGEDPLLHGVLHPHAVHASV